MAKSTKKKLPKKVKIPIDAPRCLPPAPTTNPGGKVLTLDQDGNPFYANPAAGLAALSAELAPIGTSLGINVLDQDAQGRILAAWVGSGDTARNGGGDLTAPCC